MRAAVWQGPGEMELGEAPEPDCPRDGALLKVVACGICGTDVRAFYNGDRRIGPGWILGHEICGEIVETGPDADGDLEASTGDLVHVISTLHCGRCSLCTSYMAGMSSPSFMRSARPTRRARISMLRTSWRRPRRA